jgi:class 3 adenylate cyclase
VNLLDIVRDVRRHLEENGRVSLRMLRRQFELDDDALEDVIEELVDVQRVAHRDGNVLAWAEPADSTARPPAAEPTAREPRDYTPKHLADKILQSKSALEGERKQVTVLFADVKGSMELAEQLGAEEWHRILERFFEIMTEGVHRFEGTVNQYTGDGIMALFGAPIAHEDHAHRACYAALHLSSTLKAYADALRVEHGLNFSVRMGINSGDVVVGRIGDDLRMDYTAQGHTVGLAQRMETLAESGKALLAADTIDLVHGYFEIRDLGAMKVKGVDAPVRVAELEGFGRMRTRLDRSRARGLSKFVGRDEEMGRLDTALRRTLEGDGQAVGVMAEAGSGESRLCFEFLEMCRSRGITVRSTTGVPHGRAVPLQPILEFYREIFGIASEDSDTQARLKIAGSIAQSTPEELDSLPLLFDFLRVPDPARPAPDLPPEERLQALIALLRRITAARSRREPAVLVFEDMHWVDPDSETIIEAVVDAAVGTRTLVLLNFRPEYRANWAGRTHYQQISLRPLDGAATALLLADWLGDDASLTRFAKLVTESTGGNPFFMEEVVQAGIESGALVGTRGRFRLERPIESIEVPSTVQSLLAARIDRLDETSKRLLQTAAVIGDELPELLLERVAELDSDALRAGIRRLVQGEFLYEASLYPVSEFAFKHPLTREVAYASLLRERRQALHAQVAQAIEALAGDAVDQRATLLAHHWEQAGRNVEAARWHTHTAVRLGLNVGESTFHWRKVIALLEGEPETEESRAMLGHARSRLVYAAGRTAAPEAEIAALFEEARRGLGDGDSADLAWTLMSYAVVRFSAAHVAEAHALAAEAEAMARRLADPALLASVLATSLTIHPVAEFREKIQRLIAEIGPLCARDPSLGADRLGFFAEMPVFIMSFQLLVHSGRSAEIEALLARFRRFGEDSGKPVHALWVHIHSSAHRANQGDVEAALEHGRQALDHGQRSQNLFALVGGQIAYGRALLRAGRLDEARELLAEARAIADDRGIAKGQAVSALYPLLAEVELRRGDAQAARAAAERGVELAQRMGFRHAEASNTIWLVHALIGGGDLSAAAEVFGRASEQVAALDARDLPPRLEEARAELARHSGDSAACERALREAARLYSENGEPWLASQAEAGIDA